MKKNNLTKALIAAIAADAVVTTVAAIRSHCLVRKHEAEKKQNHNKPEVKMGHETVGEYLPMLIPGNSPVFVEKVIRAYCNYHGFRIIPNKISESVNATGYDFWFYDNDGDRTLSVYCRDEKTIKFEFRKDSVTSELEITIVSDGEDEEDKVIRTKITKSNYSKGNNEFYTKSYDHHSLEEALQVPEFRFLQEAFDFKIVPSVEYNNN